MYLANRVRVLRREPASHGHGYRAGLLLLPLAALIAVLPLIVKGNSCGHDFDFHLLSWMEAAQQFRRGILHLHWAYSAAWNAGEPRFVFYPPLSWTVGGWLGVLLPWRSVPAVYTWLALVAAGFGMYRLALEFADQHISAMVAVAYIVNPYMLFTAYERTAYAELLAAAWVPLMFVGVLRQRVSLLGIGVPVALLWLTNAPAAVMACYALAVIGLVRVATSDWLSAAGRRAALTLTVHFAGGVALGLGLAAYFVVPAAYERRWVEINMVMVPGMRIADGFLFTRTGDAAHDAVLATASWIAVAMLAAATGALIGAWCLSSAPQPGTRQPGTRQHVRTLAALALAIAYLLTPLSAGLWRMLPEMQFLQFPWRLVALLTALTGAALAMALDRRRQMAPGHGFIVAFCSLVVALILVFAASWSFYQQCDTSETVATRLAVFAARTGSEPTDEYTPKDADNDTLARSSPAYWLADTPDAAAPGGSTPAPAPMYFTVAATHAELLVINLRAYPAWQLQVNGVTAVSTASRADGLIVLSIAAGRSSIDIRYRRTPDELIGIAISSFSLLVAAVLFVLGRRDSARERSLSV